MRGPSVLAGSSHLHQKSLPRGHSREARRCPRAHGTPSPNSCAMQPTFRQLGSPSRCARRARRWGWRPTPIQAACIGQARRPRRLGSAETRQRQDGGVRAAGAAGALARAVRRVRGGALAGARSPSRSPTSSRRSAPAADGVSSSSAAPTDAAGARARRAAASWWRRRAGWPTTCARRRRARRRAPRALPRRRRGRPAARRRLRRRPRLVLGQLPGRRQTLLFSATMSGALRRLQTLALREPFVADLAPQGRWWRRSRSSTSSCPRRSARRT